MQYTHALLAGLICGSAAIVMCLLCDLVYWHMDGRQDAETERAEGMDARTEARR